MYRSTLSRSRVCDVAQRQNNRGRDRMALQPNNGSGRGGKQDGLVRTSDATSALWQPGGGTIHDSSIYSSLGVRYFWNGWAKNGRYGVLRLGNNPRPTGRSRAEGPGNSSQDVVNSTNKTQPIQARSSRSPTPTHASIHLVGRGEHVEKKLAAVALENDGG